MPYKLTVRKGPKEGQSYPLTAPVIIVGRDPMADIVISDPEVSRQHARLTPVEGDAGAGYEVQDLGSTNGTFIDGRRLAGEPYLLAPGDIVSMGGNVTLIYEAEEEPDEVEEPAVGVYESGASPVGETPGIEEQADWEEPAQTTPLAEEAVEVEADEWELPSFEEEPAYEEPAFEEVEVDTVAYEEDSDELPSFEESVELPDFDEEPKRSYEPPQYREAGPPPPPPPAPAEQAGSNRNRNTIIAIVVVLLLLCCCLSLVAAWFLGDWFLNSLGIYY